MNGLDCVKYQKSRQNGTQWEFLKYLMRIKQRRIVIFFSKKLKKRQWVAGLSFRERERAHSL